MSEIVIEEVSDRGMIDLRVIRPRRDFAIA